MLEMPSSAAALSSGRPLSRARAEVLAAILGVSSREVEVLVIGQRRVPPGPEELPYVELADGDSRRRYHYRLDADKLSRLPEIPFRVGRGRGRGLKVAHRDDGGRVEGKKPSKHKFKPHTRKKKRTP